MFPSGRREHTTTAWAGFSSRNDIWYGELWGQNKSVHMYGTEAMSFSAASNVHDIHYIIHKQIIDSWSQTKCRLVNIRSHHIYIIRTCFYIIKIYSTVTPLWTYTTLENVYFNISPIITALICSSTLKKLFFIWNLYYIHLRVTNSDSQLYRKLQWLSLCKVTLWKQAWWIKGKVVGHKIKTISWEILHNHNVCNRKPFPCVCH